MHEIYKTHRPTSLAAVIGQPEACRVLGDFIKKKRIPHAILFTGPSGCGKTTLARIVRSELSCQDLDFSEMNCADFRGIDMVREMRSRMGLAAMGGGCRVYLIDECHKLTNDAQTALLKMLEDTPKHVYFMLCTTDPNKMLRTLLTRCTEVRVKPVTGKVLGELVGKVARKEKIAVGEEVIEKIVEVADGSPRKALVLLDQIREIDDEETQLNAIQSSDIKAQAIEICRTLMNPRAVWADMAKVLKGVEEDPESIRWMVLGYMTNVLLGGGKMAPRAYNIIQIFRDNFFDSKKAGLVSCCYEVFSPK